MHADLLLFTATANLSIVSLNLSLMLNRVGFYQASPHSTLPLKSDRLAQDSSNHRKARVGVAVLPLCSHAGHCMNLQAASVMLR